MVLTTEPRDMLRILGAIRDESLSPDDLAHLIDENAREETKRKAKRDGIEEGKKEGRKEGIAEGQRATLVRLLERRFGPLPAGAHERIAKAEPPDLERWLDQVLAAATLDDVLGGAS